MERFSERMGFKPVREVLQKDAMDDELRTRLWNCITKYYIEETINPYITQPDAINFLKKLWDEHLKRSLDTLSKTGIYTTEVWEKIRNYFFNSEWFEVYDFIEFISDNYPQHIINYNFRACCNNVLKEEISAYRFVDKMITPITSDQEISEIEDALHVPLKPVQEHLKRSLELLADRENPDYRNSIKESISAVESMCKIMTGDSNIRNALNRIRKDWDLHDNLKTAFQNLYSYTSASSGIRHAMTSDPNVGQEEAKFMLITCSAFVNYLIAKASKAGMDLTTTSSK